MTTTTPNKSGRGWAYFGALLGGLVSVAANVAHSFIPPHGAPEHWHPQTGAVAFAIVWPVFLFIAVEMLARVAWPNGFWWGLLRFGGLVPVALVAAFVSYKHLSALLTSYHEQGIVCAFGPLAVDGLMVMATGALLATGARTRRARTAAPDPATPVAATAVPASTSPEAPKAPARKAPARKAAPKKAPAAKAPTKSARTAPRKTATPAVSTTTAGESAASPASPAPVVPAAPAVALAPSTTDTLVTTVDAAKPLAKPVPAAMLTRAAHIAEAHRTEHGTPITAGELAVRMRVNSDTAAQLLAVMDLQPDSPTRPVTTVNGTPVGVTR